MINYKIGLRGDIFGSVGENFLQEKKVDLVSHLSHVNTWLTENMCKQRKLGVFESDSIEIKGGIASTGGGT